MTCATLNFFPSKHKCASSQHSDKNGGNFLLLNRLNYLYFKRKINKKKISYGFLLFELDFPKLNFCILEPSVWDLEDLGSTQFSHRIQIHILSKTFQEVHKFFIFFLTYFRSFHPSSPNNTFHSVHK